MISPEITYRKRFIIDKLPDPITPADEHLQIFENYIGDGGLRLRSARLPSTDERWRFFERRERNGKYGIATSSLPIGKDEYEGMRPLRGREIRKNRYQLEDSGRTFEIDVFLGDLWGLNVATLFLESESEAERFEAPGFCLLDISEDPFFDGASLADKNFEDVRSRFSKAKGES